MDTIRRNLRPIDPAKIDTALDVANRIDAWRRELHLWEDRLIADREKLEAEQATWETKRDGVKYHCKCHPYLTTVDALHESLVAEEQEVCRINEVLNMI